MSQFLCPQKNCLMSSKDMTSSHPVFWSQRRPLADVRSSELLSMSYPPKTNFCASLLSQISAQFVDFRTKCVKNSFVNPRTLQTSSSFDHILRKMAPNRTDGSPVTTSCAEEVKNAEDMGLDSDSSNEKSNKIQINDSKVLDSMQSDRQKKKKRKRRRRRKKMPTDTDSADKRFQNQFLSVFLVKEEDLSDTESEDLLEQIGPELEQLCQSFYFDYFFTQNRESGKY